MTGPQRKRLQKCHPSIPACVYTASVVAPTSSRDGDAQRPTTPPNASRADRIALRAIPDDRQLTPPAAASASDREPHDGSLALPRRHERRQIEKDVPAARPTKDTHPVSVLVKGAQGVELDGHSRP